MKRVLKIEKYMIKFTKIVGGFNEINITKLQKKKKIALISFHFLQN